MTKQRAEYVAAKRKYLAGRRKLLIGRCQNLFNYLALCKHQPNAEHLALLAGTVNESRDTIQEFGGALVANQPLEVCGVKAAGVAPVVWHMGNRVLLLAKTVNGEGEINPETEILVRAYIEKLFDIDTDWLESELSIEAAKKVVVEAVGEYDRRRWEGNEVNDLLDVRERLPQG